MCADVGDLTTPDSGAIWPKVGVAFRHASITRLLANNVASSLRSEFVHALFHLSKLMITCVFVQGNCALLHSINVQSCIYHASQCKDCPLDTHEQNLMVAIADWQQSCVALLFPQTKRSLRSEWGSYLACIELPLYSRISRRGLLA